ncbi:MAG: hypothetical protein LBM95_04830 [Lactobacillales bacterium]|jgi:hypothetical protein|nr:hypothetical protein [Lactobacillales bacterium]
MIQKFLDGSDRPIETGGAAPNRNYYYSILRLNQDKGFDRLEHPEAEAQLDFGTMEVVNDGEYMDAHVLVRKLSTPYFFFRS